MFKGRKLIIATKHKKEIVIAPILEKGLGVKCFTDETFDTDRLGTFTGEIERKLDPIAMPFRYGAEQMRFRCGK
jgi:hypothetical protein